MAIQAPTVDVAARSRAMMREEKKVILASSAGTIFEWYDFYLHGSLAAIIGAQFFSGYHGDAGSMTELRELDIAD